MPIRPEVGYESLQVPELTKTRDMTDQIHAYLRHLIIDRRLEPGATLNQAGLARRLGVSRIPMREAFRLLQQEGLIEVELNQRATISLLNVDELNGLYGTRIVLEALAVHETSGSLSAEEVEEARSLLVVMDTALREGEVDDWVVAHRSFHAICTARADAPLAQVIRSFSERSERYLRFARSEHPGASEAARREHHEILAAIETGDADGAAALIARHLEHSALLVLADLGETSPGTVVQEAVAMASARMGRAE